MKSRSPAEILNSDYIPKITSFLRELDIKERIIIRLLNTVDCLSMFDHFVGLALKWLNKERRVRNRPSISMQTNR